MYEYISGLVAEATPTYAVVEAGGVGYFIHISLKTYADIEQAKEAKLFVHFIVREDQQQLFGFSTKIERELFRQLISVSGVGGNTARMILSTYTARELQNIIATENALLLKNVKGLGLKTAQKIIVELSGKMLELGASDMMLQSTVATHKRPQRRSGRPFAVFLCTDSCGICLLCEGAHRLWLLTVTAKDRVENPTFPLTICRSFAGRLYIRIFLQNKGIFFQKRVAFFKKMCYNTPVP